MAASTCRDEEWENLWMFVGRMQKKKNPTHTQTHTNRSFFYLRGHPQIPVGDVLTELPTKLDAESGERKKSKKEKKKKNVNDLPILQRTNCEIHRH